MRASPLILVAVAAAAGGAMGVSAHPAAETDARCHMHKETGVLHCPQKAPAGEGGKGQTAPGRTVYFRNCNEAWQAGVAPIWRDDPGYRKELDGDLDGWACEPYRRRRR